MTILQLNPTAYRGQLSAPKKTGINSLFRGKIQVNDGAEPIRCYIKPLPDYIPCPVKKTLVENRELVAEAVGYVLAREAGLNVPKRAGVILLEHEQIPPEALPAPVPGVSPDDGMLAWFSEDMIHPDYALKYFDVSAPPELQERMLRNLVNIIKNTPSVHKILAFDDWLLNSDRHFGNLLVGKGSPILIDHGRIFGYPNWQPGSFGQDVHEFRNRLLDLILLFDSGWGSSSEAKSGRLFAYEGLKHSFQKTGESIARNTLLEFFEEDDCEAVVELLSSRVQDEKYNQVVGLLL